MSSKILAVKDINKNFEVKDYIFGDRDKLETDETYRQLIPYLVLMHNERVAVFQRTARSKEKRLHGMKMIGVGGHINEKDSMWCNQDIEQFVMNGAKREIFEEIRFLTECSFGEPLFRGFLVCNDAPVDRVHIGAMFTIQVNEASTVLPQFRSNDQEIKFRGWEYPTRLVESEFETWSRIAISAILGDTDQLKEEWNAE